MISGDAVQSAASQLPGASVEVPVQLCPVAVAAQTCHNLGIFDESHVAVQSFHRFCLIGLGKLRVEREYDFEALKSFQATLQSRCGRSASYLLHGAGATGEDEPLSNRDYVARLNSGAYHPDTVRRWFPATDDTMDTVILYDLLNFMHAARRAKTTYMHTVRKRICLAATSADGMLIKQGHMFDEESGMNFGAASGPYGIERGRQLDALDDDGLRKYLADDPLAVEMDEYMIATADGAVVGHLGASMKSPGGGAATIIAGVARYLPIVACFGCVLEAHQTGGSMADAEAMCDIYCDKNFAIWDAKSGVLLYTDKGRGELRSLKMMDIPAPNAMVLSGLVEPTGVALRGDVAYAAFAIVLSDPGNGIATKIFVGEDEVGDISAKDDNTVAVAMTRCIVVLHRAKGLWTVTRLPTFDNAKFRGVSWSPDPMIIYGVDESQNCIWQLKAGGGPPTRIAGTQKRGALSIGGRATACALQGPTFCCQVGESIVFAETAAGQLRLLTDIYPWVHRVMSTVASWACSFEHTADAAAHTTSLADAVKATRALDELMRAPPPELRGDGTTRRRRAGPRGNVPACVRACVSCKIGFYERVITTLAALGVPAHVAREVRAAVFGTPRNEKFFSTMRALRAASPSGAPGGARA
ncbi:hypothetical protein JL720_8548 [Aureococcus anophagefferens]|nr:hypothetical protein JL720_8548 [Aureococcus anophagefferens]